MSREHAVRRGRLLAEVGSGALFKKMAGYHQFHAVGLAVAETLRAAEMLSPGRQVLYPRIIRPAGPVYRIISDRMFLRIWCSAGTPVTLSPWLTTSTSGHSATKPLPSRSTMAVNRLFIRFLQSVEFAWCRTHLWMRTRFRIIADLLCCQWSMHVKLRYRNEAEPHQHTSDGKAVVRALYVTHGENRP